MAHRNTKVDFFSRTKYKVILITRIPSLLINLNPGFLVKTLLHFIRVTVGRFNKIGMRLLNAHTALTF